MSFKSALLAAAATLTLATTALARDITIDDAYARSAGANAKAGAAFMMIHNTGDTDDRLIEARSDVSARVELHTHKINDQGVAQMMHVPEGFVIPAGGMHALARGGDHVMFMGIKAPFEQGAMVPVTLVFEKAGEIEVEIPVDLERQGGGHGQMKKN
ncbi:copper chaperone PCu(A)C [Ruegeria aquimaris]|uniref:Copper chaperone PCu(A)C n=1 Tax=Ruegeria aquimaris TaxID=2984333 RepID=A0ABT3AIT4_9RHOB|nr:copper chaperone PCu(A)C [Ruegeria sp. XHP0148]MCV2888582.1 copper chaperone PCu(A)C [Ruegeria sp. XHP0148]